MKLVSIDKYKNDTFSFRYDLELRYLLKAISPEDACFRFRLRSVYSAFVIINTYRAFFCSQCFLVVYVDFCHRIYNRLLWLIGTGAKYGTGVTVLTLALAGETMRKLRAGSV